jgi:hypothetical protein
MKILALTNNSEIHVDEDWEYKEGIIEDDTKTLIKINELNVLCVDTKLYKETLKVQFEPKKKIKLKCDDDEVRDIFLNSDIIKYFSSNYFSRRYMKCIKDIECHDNIIEITFVNKREYGNINAIAQLASLMNIRVVA